MVALPEPSAFAKSPSAPSKVMRSAAEMADTARVPRDFSRTMRSPSRLASVKSENRRRWRPFKCQHKVKVSYLMPRMLVGVR